MRKLTLAFMAFALLLTAPAFAPTAYADEAEGAYEGVGETCKQIRRQIADNDGDGVWLTESIVECIKAVIVGSDEFGVTGAFEIFMLSFYPAVAPAIQAAVTLAVVLFGVLLVAGMIEKTSRDSFVFLMKLAMIVYFVQTSTVQWVFDSSIATLESMTEAVFTFGDGAEAEGRCRVGPTDGLWDRVDCMLDVIIGIRKDVLEDGITNNGDATVSPDQEGLKRGMLAFFFANIGSGGMGAVIIGFLGLYTAYTFVFAVIKSIHTYLAAVLALAFILAFMPMFVPMLFFKSTRNFFDKWYRIAVSFIIQPVILFGFLSLMMIAFDTVLVSGNHSVSRIIAGDCIDDETLNECLEKRGVYTKKRINEQGVMVSRASGVASRFSDNLTGISGAAATPMGTSLRDSGAIPGMVERYRPIDGMDYSRLAQLMENTADDAEAKKRLGYAAIILALTCFVYLSMLNYIPTMATDLAGGVFEVPNLYERVGQHVIGSNQAEAMAKRFSSQVRNSPTVKNFANLVGGRS